MRIHKHPPGKPSNNIARIINQCHESSWDKQLILNEASCLSYLRQLVADEHICRFLTSLDLQDAHLFDTRVLAKCLIPLTNLTSLNLRNNYLNDTKSLVDGLKPLSKLTTLDLGNNGYFDSLALAEGLRSLTRLTTLNLWCNTPSDAKALAESLKLLTTLTTLDLSGNRLKDTSSIGESIKLLKNLTTLVLQGNSLADAKALAVGLRPLTKLTTLDLSWNMLADVEALSECLISLTNLITLNLGWNGLSDGRLLAAGFKPLKNLTTLILRNNQVTNAQQLVKVLKLLTNLTTLDLSSNHNITVADIIDLGVLLPPRGKLRTLIVEDIPQLELPSEVVQSCDAVRILDELNRTRRPIYQIKIVVLGDGRMGKTQLVNRLIGKEFEEESDCTPDFEMHSLRFPKVGPSNQTVTSRLYDFGGQTYLWNAHRFFLASQHNLYIVVIDGTRQDKLHLESWLRYLRHYIGRHRSSKVSPTKIPVLIVVTNCDRNTAINSEGRSAFKTISETEAVDLVHNYAEFAEVRIVRNYSSKSKEGLDDVKQQLRNLVGGMEYVFKTQYAISLHRVKDYLEGDEPTREILQAEPFDKSQPIERLNELFRRAQQQIDKNVDEGAFLFWLQILRNLGIVHWVGDLPSVQSGIPIANTIYHPDWVRKLVYGIIRTNESIRRGGITDEDTLCRLMCTACGTHNSHIDSQTHSCHRQILDLMQACHLIFPAKDHTYPKWLVLDWLGKTTGFIFDHAPACVLDFNEYLPESLLLRFAGEWFSQIANGDTFNCLSREHVVVRQWEDGNTQVAIKADWRNQRIVVWSLGGTQIQRDELVAQVKSELLKLARREGMAPIVVTRTAYSSHSKDLTNNAKEQKLNGLLMVTVAEANQICRLETMSDMGIDAHIEYLEDNGDASGCRTFLQLKSGSSHLRHREGDNKEIFDVKNRRHLEYWVKQQGDVCLVIANGNWHVRWMNVTDYLNNRSDKSSLQIEFSGEELNRDSVLSLRKQCLAKREAVSLLHKIRSKE